MSPFATLPGPVRAMLAAGPVLLLLPGVRTFVDARMSVLMLVEFPSLVVAGCCASTFLPEATRRVIARCNAMSLVSYSLLLLVSSYWMVPAALDEALTSPTAYFARHVTWFAVGFLLAIPGHDTKAAVTAFFVGNLAWMTASAGWLYRETEARLCVNYLIDDQLLAGGGLITAALLLLVGLAWAARYPDFEYRDHASSHQTANDQRRLT